jgi:hypothetical protein
MALQGKTFETPIQVHTDISAGGNFNYVTFKKRIAFRHNGEAELTWEVLENKWSWPGLFADERYLGVFDKKPNEFNTFRCELHHSSKGKIINMTCVLNDSGQLLCNVVLTEDGITFSQNEIYEQADFS